MKKPFVALQMYTVRDFANKDLADTFRKVKEIGYDFVELAGVYDMQFSQIHKLLDDSGLCAISAHVQYTTLAENMQAMVSAYKSLGCEYITIPMIDADKLPGGTHFQETKEILENFCDICKKEGVTPVYHNHALEFEKLANGKFKLDELFDQLPGLTAQFDTGWIKEAGQSPEAYIKKYAGRCPMIHIKDNIVGSYSGYEDRPVGKGSQNIPATLDAVVAAGVIGMVVEVDNPVDITSMDAAQESREYLKSLGY